LIDKPEVPAKAHDLKPLTPRSSLVERLRIAPIVIKAAPPGGGLAALDLFTAK
jgi:hypothetical protein